MAVLLPFTEHLHLNEVFSFYIHEHLLSYECLTTLLIALTMERTLPEINSQFRRQVNKRVLRIVHQYLRDKATATDKSTSCLSRHPSVHKDEIIRDKQLRSEDNELNGPNTALELKIDRLKKAIAD